MDTERGVDIHLSEGMVRQIKARGHDPTATAIKLTVCKWHGIVRAGEDELQTVFNEDELGLVETLLAEAVRIDKLSCEDFWGMNASRIGALVAITEKENTGLGERCLDLSELGVMALKERVCGAVILPTGRGGKPKGAARGSEWPDTKTKQSKRD